MNAVSSSTFDIRVASINARLYSKNLSRNEETEQISVNVQNKMNKRKLRSVQMQI